MDERQKRIYEPDYLGAYETFDGNMPGCLGKNCPNSCCGEKTVLNYKSEPVTFRTSFIDDTEYFHQFKLDWDEPLLASLGVNLITIKDINNCTAYLAQNCLDPENGCKLAQIGRKPISCRIAPIGFLQFDHTDESCPALAEIRRQGGEHILEMIADINKKSGYSARIWARQMAARRRMT